MKKTENVKVLTFARNWQEISQLETSLNKILRTKSNFNISEDCLETVLNGAKTLIKIIDSLKHQQKQYKNLEQSYAMMQNKLLNHQSIVANLQKSYAERIKSLIEESRSFRQQSEKIKKSNQDLQDQNRVALNALKTQIIQYQQTIKNLEQEKKSLIQQRNNKNKEIQEKCLQIQQFKDSIFKEWEIKPNTYNMENILCSNLSAHIFLYLTPSQICKMEILNKKTRLFILKSKSCRLALNKSILQIKNRKMSYYHKHIQYFEKLANKIPQQIIQTTFYQHHIAKEPMGTQIMSILNSSALIFQGKFMDVESNQVNELNNQQYSLNKIISQAKQNYLDVQESIIDEYIEQKKNARQKSLKEMDLMYKKIQSTAQLYSADVQNIGLFLKNVLKNFSKVFVLSKNLYSQARNLQCLNTFLLDHLVQWDKSDIKYTNQIEDLKAQLYAEKKLKLFFTEKSHKSEQKALAEQNSKLNIQMKYNQTLKNLEQLSYDKKLIEGKLQETEKSLKQAINGNKDLKKAFEASKKKHNEIIQQLSVVKETIIRMNLV